MSRIQILKEDVIVSEVDLGDLTTDCMFVHLEDGKIDVVRAQAMVKVFDEYHDAGKRITRIDFSGGRLNPKTQTPRLE
jgi:hypothetical protein